jgi:hypothetical protein
MIVACRVARSGRRVPAFQIDERFFDQVARHAWYLSSRGYLMASVGGRKVRLHRFVWSLHHGSCPVELDHVNRDTLDNRLENLRAATRSLNCRNVRRGGRFPTGVRPRGLKFQSLIRRGGRQVSLGCFATAEEASAAYEAERLRLIAEAAAN